MSTKKNKIWGLLCGGALGDALGAPHEFTRLSYEYTGKLEHKLWFRTRFEKEKVYHSVGQVTDDTEMATCILNSLIENDMKYSRDDVLRKYLEWANSGSRCMGRNTRELMKGVKTIKGYEKRYEKKFQDDETKRNTQSNGALMRCGPLVFAMVENMTELIDIIKMDCYLTNPNQISYVCNVVLITAIHMALYGFDKSFIMEKILRLVDKHGICDTLSDLCDNVNKAVNKEYFTVDKSKKGWCVYALYLAFYAFIHFDSYHEGINYVIREGGDTDTNACIAGYLLGAYYGMDGMISDPVTKENIKILMLCSTDQSTKPRPDQYIMANYASDENITKICKYTEIIPNMKYIGYESILRKTD